MFSGHAADQEEHEDEGKLCFEEVQEFTGDFCKEE